MDYELNEEFRIDNDKLADWALRKIAEDVGERDRLISIAQNQIEELQAKIEEITTQYENRTRFLKGHLQSYFNRVPHKETKTQETYKLLSGSLVMKKPTVKIIHNDEELIKALDGTEYVETKKVLRWGDYKKNLGIEGADVIDLDTGEIITACSVEDVPASFDIKF